jgi:hypothetical protein
MKKFKLVLVLLVGLVLTSCNNEDASIEKSLVVEQVNTNGSPGCSDCLAAKYKYRIKLKTYSGSVSYYTDYKHEIGDTLVSLYEFTDNREGVIKQGESALDSLSYVNKNLQKKNDELELYNELLMGIVQDNAIKKSSN